MTSEDIEAEFRDLENGKTEEDFIKEDAYILQANYLSEIERLYKDKDLNRKNLAQNINISPSYLTQVFRGDKPLNFITLAKIKRALNIEFYLTASFASEKKTEIQLPKVSNFIPFDVSHLFDIKSIDSTQVQPNTYIQFTTFNHAELAKELANG